MNYITSCQGAATASAAASLESARTPALASRNWRVSNLLGGTEATAG